MKSGKSWAIMVLGVAGAGKTTFGRRLASALGIKFLDVPEFVKKKKLHSGYDRKARAYLIDLRKLSIAAGAEISKEAGVIASIYAFKPRGIKVRYAIILRIRPTKLIKILKARKYPLEKICENVSAELIDQPLYEAVRKFGRKKIIQLDVTDRELTRLASEVAEKIKENKLHELNQEIDWIKVLEDRGELGDLLRFIESANP